MKKPSAWLIRLIRNAVIAILVIVLAVYASIMLFAQTDIELTFYSLKSDKVSSNIRIVQLTDLHLKQYGENNKYLVSQVKSLHPDIVAITGDMNKSGKKDYSVVISLCQQLVEIAPVYYSLGNHEYQDVLFNESNIIKDIENTGAVVMHNSAKEIEIKGTKLQIMGLSESVNSLEGDYGDGSGLTRKEKWIEKVGKYDGFRLLLCHRPEVFLESLKDFEVDLALSGHTHGGLIRIPFVGGIYAPDQGLFPKIVEGLYNYNNKSVIVCRGLGKSGLVPRVNDPPEIAVIDINWY